MGHFGGRVALVTGGSSGIGLAVSEAFARGGARVVISGRNRERGERASESISRRFGEAIYVETDVARPSSVRALVQVTVETYGRLDFACNNAATLGPLLSITDHLEEDVESTVATNLRGVWLCMQQELQQMLPQGEGAIVNMSSATALRASPKTAIYSATKAAIETLTKSAARQYATAGVRVNAVAPGAIETPMLEELAVEEGVGDMERGAARFRRWIPMGRFGAVEEAASAVTWLCSAESSYVTGHVLVVDGGLTA